MLFSQVEKNPHKTRNERNNARTYCKISKSTQTHLSTVRWTDLYLGYQCFWSYCILVMLHYNEWRMAFVVESCQLQPECDVMNSSNNEKYINQMNESNVLNLCKSLLLHKKSVEAIPPTKMKDWCNNIDVYVPITSVNARTCTGKVSQGTKLGILLSLSWLIDIL